MSKSSKFYKRDCAFFNGDVPCRPHKEHGVHCDDCEHYKPLKEIILIIKLGAIGDVIRTTPLLHKIWEEHPTAAVWWVTYTPEVVPSEVDRVFPFTLESILTLQATEFFKIINLDKDPQACALVNSLSAKKKSGFILENGKPAPADELAEHKFLTGIFDD